MHYLLLKKTNQEPSVTERRSTSYLEYGATGHRGLILWKKEFKICLNDDMPPRGTSGRVLQIQIHLQVGMSGKPPRGSCRKSQGLPHGQRNLFCRRVQFDTEGFQTDKKKLFVIAFVKCISSVESQKGVIAAQRCSVENQKGAIAVQSQWQ